MPLDAQTNPKTYILQQAINRTWTVQQICKRFDITPMTVHVWRRRGLPCVVIKGSKRPAIRFVIDEVKPWIKAQLNKRNRK